MRRRCQAFVLAGVRHSQLVHCREVIKVVEIVENAPNRRIKVTSLSSLPF